jgi:hypothetical protein
MRLRFEIDEGIGGTIDVTADALRVDEAGQRALLHLIMCLTADAHESAAHLELRSIRAVRRDPQFPKPLMIGVEPRWLRAELDSFADNTRKQKR